MHPPYDIADETADKKSWNCSRSEHRKDRQCFGQANLHFTITEWREHKSYYDVDCSDHRCLCHEEHREGFLFLSFLSSFSFVLRVEGHGHSHSFP